MPRLLRLLLLASCVHAYANVPVSTLREKVVSSVRQLIYKQRSSMDTEKWIQCSTSNGRPPAMFNEFRVQADPQRTVVETRKWASLAADYITEQGRELLEREDIRLDEWKMSELRQEIGDSLRESYFLLQLHFNDPYTAHNASDQEASFIWQYFHDRHWDRSEFPRSLDTVDATNAYMQICSEKEAKDQDEEKRNEWYRREWLGVVEPYPDQPMGQEVIIETLFPLYPQWISAEWLDSQISAQNEALPENKRTHFLFRELLVSQKKKHTLAVRSIAHRLATHLVSLRENRQPIPTDDQIFQQIVPLMAAGDIYLAGPPEHLRFNRRNESAILAEVDILVKALLSLSTRLSYTREWMENRNFASFDRDEFESDWKTDGEEYKEENLEHIAHRIIHMSKQEWELRSSLARADWPREWNRLIEKQRNRLDTNVKYNSMLRPNPVEIEDFISMCDDLAHYLLSDEVKLKPRDPSQPMKASEQIAAYMKKIRDQNETFHQY